MQFFSTLLVGAVALTSFVAAQSSTLVITSEISSVIAGRPVTIEYQATDLEEPVTIDLRYGETGNLDTQETITTTATGGSFTWTPSTDLPNRADYTFEIRQGSEFNFAPIRFELTGGSDEDDDSSSSSSAAPTSTPISTTASSATVTPTSMTVPSNGTTMTTTHSSTGRPTSSPTAVESSTTETAPTGAPTGAAATLGSPAALVLGAIAALAYLQ